MKPLAILLLLIFAAKAGAQYRTPNFTVSAPTPQFAKQMGDAAEVYRAKMAELWIGQKYPKWAEPCVVTVKFDKGNSGVTHFGFDNSEAFGWEMNIQGSPERLMDSVLPHEITHTVFASHFRQPIPRWADEGGACTVEHESERANWEKMIFTCLKTHRCCGFDAIVRASS